MAHFAVAHLVGRKSDGESAGLEEGARSGLPEAVPYWSLGQLDRDRSPSHFLTETKRVKTDLAAFQRGESAALMTTRLRLLLDDYGEKDLRAAVQEALLKGTPRTASVAYILGQQKRRGRSQAGPVDLSRRPDLKDLYVKPHASETYDALSRSTDDDDSECH